MKKLLLSFVAIIASLGLFAQEPVNMVFRNFQDLLKFLFHLLHLPV